MELVLALVKVINAEAPRLTADEILDPMVRIRMDSAKHKGIKTWYMWLHLIRNYGRISDLRLTGFNADCDPKKRNLIHVSGRWSGIMRPQFIRCASAHHVNLRYLVEGGRITAIWTSRSNYEFIFGRWIKYPVLYWLFLAWAYVYFEMLRLRGRDFLVDRP
jgi:hypothetical protein